MALKVLERTCPDEGGMSHQTSANGGEIHHDYAVQLEFGDVGAARFVVGCHAGGLPEGRPVARAGSDLARRGRVRIATRAQ